MKILKIYCKLFPGVFQDFMQIFPFPGVSRSSGHPQQGMSGLYFTGNFTEGKSTPVTTYTTQENLFYNHKETF